LGTLLAPPKPKPKVKAKAKAKPTAKPKARAAPRLATVPTTIAPLKPRVARPTAASAPRVARPAAAVTPRVKRNAEARPAAPAPRPEPAAPATGKWMASVLPGITDRGALHRMNYWLYVPDRPAAETAERGGMPMIVMLHGCEQSATLFAQGTRMNHLAETAGYVVLYPQQSATAHPHRCWKWYDRATQQGGGDVTMIVGIIKTVIASYPIDRSRIYICGLSAGAGMANIVALNHPELFAALGLHSGPSFGAGHSTIGALAVMQHGGGGRVDGAIAEVLGKRPEFPSLPTILIHGEGDRVVRPINQTHLTRQAMLLNQLPSGSRDKVVLKSGNKRGHPYELRDVYRGGRVVLRVARIAELQHAWCGGDERLSFNVARGPNASKMMLDFFSRQRRRGLGQ
jgi:poly(hydroxyalkanoate) depolymerase family esterase